MKRKTVQAVLRHGPAPVRLAETQARCAALLPHKRRRTGFWSFLSAVWRFTAPPLWGAQAGTSALFALAAAHEPELPSFLGLLGPLLALACLPALFAGQHHGMAELEASTCAAGAELTLARLVLAGGADLLVLTAALGLGVRLGGAGAWAVLLYLLVPFLGCSLVTLAVLRRGSDLQHGGAQRCAVVCLATAAGLLALRRYAPEFYTASAVGGWAAGFVLFLCFFARELARLVRACGKGVPYGTYA